MKIIENHFFPSKIIEIHHFSQRFAHFSLLEAGHTALPVQPHGARAAASGTTKAGRGNQEVILKTPCLDGKNMGNLWAKNICNYYM